MAKPTRILDSHIHLADSAHVRYRWHEMPDVPATISVADYRTASAGFPVEGFIFIEAGAHEADSAKEARWVASLIGGGAPVTAIVAQADMRRGETVAEELDPLTDIPLVKGIRWILEPPFEKDDQCCIRPDFVVAARLLSRYGYSLDISVKNRTLPNVVQLVRACPETRFVLDHIGKPDIAEEQWKPWNGQIRELAKLENLVCKISGVPMEAGEGWTVDSIRRYVETVAEAFGSDRILYGSDWPAQHPVGTFASWTSSIAQIMDSQSIDAVDRYFYRNAADFYGVRPA